MEQNFSNIPINNPINEGQQANSGTTPFLHKRFLGPSTFGLILLMFFFTFIDIKCNSVSLGTVKGYELATGYHINKQGTDSGESTHKEKPNLFAAAALFFAILGFSLGFIKANPGSISRIICGFLGGLMLLILYLDIKSSMNDAMSKSPGGDLLSSSIKITVEFQLAFWISLLLFIAAGVLGIVQLMKKPPEKLY